MEYMIDLNMISVYIIINNNYNFNFNNICINNYNI